MIDAAPKLIIDTSAFIPVLLKAHPTATAKILQLTVENQVILYTSQDCFDEIEEIIHRRKFLASTTRSRQDIYQMIERYKDMCQWESPSVKVSLCRDQKDNKFLSLAKHIKADFIITVDIDLLVLNPFEDTVICKGVDFIRFLEEASLLLT